MSKYELTPSTSQKSFYGKAVVTEIDGIKTLYSYGTPIIRINADGSFTRLWGGWSATTGKHIKAFCGLNKARFFELPHDITPAEKATAYSGTLFR